MQLAVLVLPGPAARQEGRGALEVSVRWVRRRPGPEEWEVWGLQEEV